MSREIARHTVNPATGYDASLASTSFQLGADLMAQLVGEHGEIDALFFSNDDLAAGAIFECQRRGIQVPRQLAICGFNDLVFAKAIVPTLTTVSIPRYEMGRQTAQCLLDRLQGRQVSCHIDVGFAISRRESTL